MMLLVTIPVALLGLWLLVRGLRGGRVGDHPRCRACGFDLFGLPSGRGRCTECGADLSRPRASVTGVRRRRPGMLAIGATLFLLATATATGSVLTRRGKIEWYHHEPAWLLARQ